MSTGLADSQPAIFQTRFARNGRGAPDNIASALTYQSGRTGKGDSQQCVFTNRAVRRITPIECERLQGFPDNYTLIHPRTSDSKRYKALGNSMAVPVIEWIGQRIAKVQKIAEFNGF